MATCVCGTRRTRHEDSSTTYIAPRPELLRHTQNSELVNTKKLSSLPNEKKHVEYCRRRQSIHMDNFVRHRNL